MQSKGGYSESGATDDLPTPDGLDLSHVNSSNNHDHTKPSSSPNEITITLNNDTS